MGMKTTIIKLKKVRTAMLNEKAFIVKPDSKLYTNYFIERKEKQKFHELALDFFKRFNLSEGGKYCINERLMIELTEEEYSQYKHQLLKDKREGLYVFKKNSTMQKEWELKVVNQCNTNNFYLTSFWSWDFIEAGRYALWNDGVNLYGCVESKGTEPKIPQYAEEIKLSEYYAKIEEMEKKE